MATYAHLPLKRLEGELVRRKNSGFPGGLKREPVGHGGRLKSEIATTQSEFEKLPPVAGVDPSLILKIKVAGLVTEDDWRKLGLSVLSIDGDKTTVLFADDKSLQAFHQKVDAYRGGIPDGQKGPQFAQLIGSIEAVSLVEPADRIGRVLRAAGFDSVDTFDASTDYILDFELHRPSSDEDAALFIYRFENTIGPMGGEIISTYNGKSILLVRAICNGDALRGALNLPELSVMDLPPQPDLGPTDISDVQSGQIDAGTPPADDAVVVGIVDSGVNFGHKLLAPTEAGSFTVVSTFGSDDEGGHGTSVASVAAFGDIEARLKAGNFDAQFRIASARVTTNTGKFPSEMSVPELMEKSIRRLHDEYGCRIINISLGDADRVYDGSRVDTWTATLDSLARELDILIVVSAGNRGNLTATYGDQILKAYPKLLLDKASRVISPAFGANLISVGAIANSNGLADEDKDLVGVQPVCGKEEPAPFTRCGPGVRNMVKPDFVDFGGNAVWDGPTQSLVSGNHKPSAGIWAFHHKPLERLFRARSGTSFSAPQLSYKAALLLSQFPLASANLLRALLAISARVPTAPSLRPEPLNEQELLSTCGYGVANPTDAATSDDTRVVLFTEDKLKLDHFAVYEVPIPSDFQTMKGEKEIRVCLAFDPPTRHTRAEYLGVTMGWRLLRGTSADDVFHRFRKWEADEGEPPKFESKYVCNSDIGPNLREKGTLQLGTYSGKKDISGYGDRYFVAVWCSRRWAPADIEEQNFAVCVQLRHENVNTLYQSLTVPIKVKV
ncbi:S8 family peptidase [Rhizobium sp. IBUN]|uniref:S8 family peptidase n=1 Tax=Rhizobium sp. IBUN TaxID=1042326 RepID=UPI000426396A|nr:S8 family peptidase [Rhizobium sp. IBUN]